MSVDEAADQGKVEGIAGQGNEEQLAEEDERDWRTPAVARKPRSPTKADIDAHYPLHLEYRDCVRIASRERASVTSTGKVQQMRSHWETQ